MMVHAGGRLPHGVTDASQTVYAINVDALNVAWYLAGPVFPLARFKSVVHIVTLGFE